MREYETVFVVRPDGSESQTNELLDKVNSIIERHSGTILRHRNLGKKELAYKIAKYNQGVYFYYNYAGDSTVTSDIERTLRLNDLSMRYLTVVLNDTIDVEARKKELEGTKPELSFSYERVDHRSTNTRVDEDDGDVVVDKKYADELKGVEDV